MSALLFLAVPPLCAQTQQPANEDHTEIQGMIQSLEEDITALQFLIGKVASAEASSREVLLYRQDERIFKLLTDFDQLVLLVSELPEDSPDKSALKQQLVRFGSEAGDALFKRIENIKQRIIKYNTQLENLSGATRVAAQAYINSIESIREKYYKTMASHIETRESLGLLSEELRDRIRPELYLYSETLTGRIEITGKARGDVQNRLSQDTNNADMTAALKELDILHDTDLQRLGTLITVLDQLELDSSEYKAVMLQQSSNISVSLFSVSAIATVIKDSWSAFKAAIEENAPDLLFRLLLFIAVLLVFRALSRITKRVVHAATGRSSLDMSELLRNILVSTSGGAVMALGVLMALSQVGISLAPMLAGLGVAGFIVGFALQDSLGNFAAGAMILIYRPFDVDDFVEVTGASGLVKKMNLVSTTITTFDNQTLVVPNSKIWGDVIKNVTAQTERRVDLEIGIGYDDDIELTEKVLHDIISAHEKVLTDPEPMIHLHTLGDSSVNFVVRPWVKTDDYWDVYWDLMREIKLRFDREGISIPFPQRDVHLYTASEP